jgi:hypothetical protein
MAAAAFAGALEEGPARLVAAGYAGPEDILSAGGYLFVCPENLGSMTGEMKTFSTLAIIP